MDAGGISEVAWSLSRRVNPQSLFGEEHLTFVSCLEWFCRLVLEGALVLLIWKKFLWPPLSNLEFCRGGCCPPPSIRDRRRTNHGRDRKNHQSAEGTCGKAPFFSWRWCFFQVDGCSLGPCVVPGFQAGKVPRLHPAAACGAPAPLPAASQGGE